VNYRPEYQHQWGSNTHYPQFRLDPLRSESAEEMLDALLSIAALSPLPHSSLALLRAGSAVLDERATGLERGARGIEPNGLTALKRAVITRTEGQSVLHEEIVLAIFDDGALVRKGEVKLTRPLVALKFPPTARYARRTHRPFARGRERAVAVTGGYRPGSATLQLFGSVGDAARSIEEGVRRAREARHPFSLGDAVAIGALVRSFSATARGRTGYAQEGLALCEENGFVLWVVMARYLRGRAIAALGQIAQGIADMETAINGVVQIDRSVIYMQEFLRAMFKKCP